MTPPIIQADYELLDEIAQRFENQAQVIAEMMQMVRRGVDKLNSGDWVGKGIDSFAAELSGEVFPALGRLTEGLSRGAALTREVSFVIQSAEQEAANLFITNNIGYDELKNSDSQTDGSIPQESWIDRFFEQIKEFRLPLWAEAGLSIIPFYDLVDIIREGLKEFTGGEADKLVLSMAVLGLAADAGWLSPEPATEALNGLIGFGKGLMKRLPAGPARDAIAELIESAGKNIAKDPSQILKLWDVTKKIVTKGDLLDELVKRPDALAHTLKQGPDFLDKILARNLADDHTATLIEHMSKMKRTPLPEKLPLPERLYGYEGVNMGHMLDSHTYTHLNPAVRIGNSKPRTTMWPEGTSATDVRSYLQETLDRLNRSGNLPTKHHPPTTVTLSNGISVQIRMGIDPQTGQKTITSFFPLSGPGTSIIDTSDMRIINDVLNP